VGDRAEVSLALAKDCPYSIIATARTVERRERRQLPDLVRLRDDVAIGEAGASERVRPPLRDNDRFDVIPV